MASTPPPGSVAAALAPLARRIDPRVPGGRPLGLRFWDGSELPAPAPPPGGAPVVVVNAPRAIARVVHERSELGFGRAWVAGEIDVDGDLAAALALTARFRGTRLGRRDLIEALRAARRVGALTLREPEPPAAEVRLRGRLHSLRRDRAAIRHHYDVSNRFYRLVLGPTMVYSCAYFEHEDEPLDSAQERKLDVVCRKLALREGDRLLDVGCGWGSLAIHAAARYGTQVVGVTISPAQAELARERVREAGLADLIEIRLADYRDTADGPYDKVASVGMVEHVGTAHLPAYFARLRSLLRPGGLLLNHGIVRPLAQPRDDRTFAARFVFPDGELPTLSTVLGEMERAGFEPRDTESLREHYALTLRRWDANQRAHREDAVAEAGEQRERVWRLHNVGAALGFERGDLSVHQVVAVARGAPHDLPLGRRAGEPAARS
ncbi:MAG TPA: cyclopropane-fatty-acyl-phospholipid synthase family protein [Thermoleophilaceae bacterium]|jgi:cyclopropane-fatty-acyl-phospholipid synthase